MKEIHCKRIVWLDYLKGICMISIILNHINGPEIYGQITYPFELVGFFFASGFTFNPRQDFRDFLFNKVKVLALPVIIFGITNLFISCLFKEVAISDRIIGIFLQIPGKWDDLWFVACLFTMELIYYIVLKVGRSNFEKLTICLVLSFLGYLSVTYSQIRLPWHIENACLLIGFLWLGNMARKEYGIKPYSSCKLWMSLIICSVVYTVLIILKNNYPIDVHLLNYGSLPFFMVSALSGLMTIIFLARILDSSLNNTIPLRFLSFIGSCTLLYYAFQSKAISVVELFYSKIGLSYESYVGSIICCFIVIISLIIPSVIIKKYFPFLLGKF